MRIVLNILVLTTLWVYTSCNSKNNHASSPVNIKQDEGSRFKETDSLNFELVAAIDVKDFFGAAKGKKFKDHSSNELGPICPLDFFIDHDFVYIPLKSNKEIRKYVLQDTRLKYQSSVRGKSTPDFFTIFNGAILYSSFDDHKIHFLNDQIDSVVTYVSNPIFKLDQNSLISSRKFYFYFSDTPDDSVYYENIYPSWDYIRYKQHLFIVSDLSDDKFNLGTSYDKGVLLREIYPQMNSKNLILDSGNGISTIECLGVVNDEMVILLADDKKIHLYYIDLESFRLNKKITIKIPFNEELLLGDFIEYWGNQFICKMMNNQIYLLGTTRNNLLLYKLSQ